VKSIILAVKQLHIVMLPTLSIWSTFR